MDLVDNIKKIQKLVNTVSNMETFIKQIFQVVDEAKGDLKLLISILKEWKQQSKAGPRVIEILTKIKEVLEKSDNIWLNSKKGN